jgi:hypothetical protein
MLPDPQLQFLKECLRSLQLELHVGMQPTGRIHGNHAATSAAFSSKAVHVESEVTPGTEQDGSLSIWSSRSVEKVLTPLRWQLCRSPL